MQASTAQTQAVAAEAELVEQLNGFLHYIWRHCSPQGGFLEVIDELGLSFSQLKALQFLSTVDAPEVSLKQLGDQLGLSLPAISRAVDGLVQRGLVTRTEDASDRRMKRVRPTKAADELIARLIDVRFAELGKFVETLNRRERDKLAAALAVLAEREEFSAPLLKESRSA
jgi:DNA-binding MarR family transcriptional regulator